jgi:RNA polymerase sigma-70 factor (ECF subfamily)
VKLDSGELALRMTGTQVEKPPSHDTQETAHLLNLAKTGDALAFERIILLHQRLVLMTALHLLGEVNDAKDAAQEVFLRLHKYLYQFDEDRHFAPWLYRMTVNVCRDIYRQRRKSATLSLSEISENRELELLTSPHDLDADLTLAEQRCIVSEGLKVLTVKEREVLVLRDIEGLSSQEVAGLLGSTQVTVRSQLSMARLKLRKFAERYLRRQV